MKRMKIIAAALIASCTFGYAIANTRSAGTVKSVTTLNKTCAVRDTTPVPKPTTTPTPTPTPTPAPSPTPTPAPTPMPPSPTPSPTPPTPTAPPVLR